ncbi:MULTISPECIES: TonB-dependent receptor plug domain-containing protein [Pseudomonas]|uniref:TonB-dependent receptor plug domain-containing protein n=1 Tax=Pseudomonas TaxID=286 RepID=UPI000A9AE634|nr:MULTISPECIES: Plug domain-containing protein [Pseudomonas]MCL8332333.1 Plug domain-containing protein [Pseudomonas juntendi]
MRFPQASFAIFTAMFTPDLVAGQTGNSTITLGDVNITQTTGVALSTENVLTSVDVLGSDQVRDKNVMNSWQLLGQMPGIQLTETGQGAESGKVSFRAFNGEGYINGIKTLIDGVPSNVNSGNQRFIDMIFPLDIEYIEVVRGTNDPRYGLHNIGGNINFATRQGGNYVDSRVTYGSFDTREVQLQSATRRATSPRITCSPSRTATATATTATRTNMRWAANGLSTTMTRPSVSG